MKRIFKYLIVITFISGIAELHGQEALNKGVYVISGTAQYSSSSVSNNGYTYSYNSGNISPQFSYFIINHLSLGAGINYNYYYIQNASYSNSGAHNFKYTSISMGPSIRYYFAIKKTIQFLEASFSYGVLGLESQYPEHQNSFSLKGGMEIFLSKSVALEPSIGYTYSHLYYSETEFSFDGNMSTFNIGMGISYYIF